MKNLLKDSILNIKKEKSKKGILFSVLKTIDEPIFLPSFDEEIEILLEKNVSLHLLERETSEKKRSYRLKEGAVLHHNFLSFCEGGEEQREILLYRNACWEAAYADFSFTSHTLNINCILEEEGAKGFFHLSGLGRKETKKVFNINFIHKAPNTESIMENYGVVRENSSLSFIGTSFIQQGAKKSKAAQIAKIMIFDPKCQASASPILKIDENDVLASHAAAEGKINEEHLFYLMSRGLKEDEAKRLITLGYLNPITTFIFDDEAKEEVRKNIMERI